MFGIPLIWEVYLSLSQPARDVDTLMMKNKHLVNIRHNSLGLEQEHTSYQANMHKYYSNYQSKTIPPITERNTQHHTTVC